MKITYIFLIIMITATIVSFVPYSSLSVAETKEEQGGCQDHDFFSDMHDDQDDQGYHAQATDHDTHDDHGHDAHDSSDVQGNCGQDDRHMHNMHDNEIEDTHSGHGHDIHTEDDSQGAHDDHGHSDSFVIDLMNDAQAKEAGIATDTVKTGSVENQIRMTGEVNFNQERIVHLIPPVSGVVATVKKKLGDPVRQGEVLAVIHSRELTDIKSEYLSAHERIALVQANFDRDKSLWGKKIIPERQFLESKQAVIETRIAMQAAERKLHALGFSEQYIEDLPNQTHEAIFKYPITAPSDGIIVEKHMVKGELVTTDTPAFIIADTSSVWIDLQVYPKDLANIKIGQKATVKASDSHLSAEGNISYISATVDRETRTALARIEIKNSGGHWRSGLFVKAVVTPEDNDPDGHLIVPKSAVQNIDGKPSVFIVTPAGYVPATVVTGRSGPSHVEILSGMSFGQTYVSSGAYELKAKMVTSTLDGHAGHGH